MIAFWDLVHALVAIALLGAVTHQGLAVWRKPAPARLFVDRFRAVPSGGYANAVVILYAATFALGAFIYPQFVLDVKGSLLGFGMRLTIGFFQLKEHLAIVGLCMLPVYWHFWRSVPLTENVGIRRFLTTLLMFATWFNLVVGHVLNNVKGLI